MERFFYASRSIRGQSVKVLEFIYRTYPEAHSVLGMPWRIGLELVEAGAEKSRRNEYWMLYCSTYPHMDSETFQGFEEWYSGIVNRAAASTKSKEEIMENVKNIIDMTTEG